MPLECLADRLRGNMHRVAGPGFCRGYKASRGTESEQKRLNGLMTTAKSVEDILELVERHHSQFDFINVATAVNRISKHAKADMHSGGQQLVGERLRTDKRFSQLMRLVRTHCWDFKAQAVANVLNGLTALQDLGAPQVDGQLAAQLGKVVKREASNMTPQEVANTLNAYAKLEEAATKKLSQSGWVPLANAVERVAPEMTPQEVANTLNAYGKMEEAAAEVSQSGWAALAKAVERVTTAAFSNEPHKNAIVEVEKDGKVKAGDVYFTVNWIGACTDGAKKIAAVEDWCGGKVSLDDQTAFENPAPEMSPQAVANILNAYVKLEKAAAKVPPEVWVALAEAVERVAPEMNPQHVANILNAYAKLEEAAAKVPQ